MATKRNVSGVPKLHNERLVILDELLSKSSVPIAKVNLVKKLNSRLPEKISVSSFDKDVRELKDLLDDYAFRNQVEISLVNKRDAGYYYSIPGFRLFGNSLSNDDRNLLLYANSLFEVFSGTELITEFRKVTQRLIDNSVLDNFFKEFPTKIVQVEKSAGFKAKSWIPKLLDAIINKECLEVVYTNAQQITSKRILSPYVLKQHDQKWYFVAYDSTSGKSTHCTNVFLLDGINAIEYTNKKYVLDTNFDPDDYFNYSIGIWHSHKEAPIDVKLAFSDTKLFNPILNNPIHHSQYCISSNEQQLIIGIKVYDTIELDMIIRKYGHVVKVIEPISLAERIKLSAKAVFDLYS